MRTKYNALVTDFNPPVVYARQANIANGPQQVNNGSPRSSHASETQFPPNKLLEASNEIPMDTRAPGAAGDDNSKMEAVGEINGTKDGSW